MSKCKVCDTELVSACCYVSYDYEDPKTGEVVEGDPYLQHENVPYCPECQEARWGE